jgi:hypothetical protein
MAKRSSSPAAPAAPVVAQDVVSTEVVATDVVTPEVVKAPKRAHSIAAAREYNFDRSVNPDEVVGAPVLKTAAGVNPKRVRVYGYDTTDGRVPKSAKVAIVPEASTPTGVTEGQWKLLAAQSGKTVQEAYDNGVASRSIRRAYRAGAIRFIGA